MKLIFQLDLLAGREVGGGLGASQKVYGLAAGGARLDGRIAQTVQLAQVLPVGD